jgi:hypothetical protein
MRATILGFWIVLALLIVGALFASQRPREGLGPCREIAPGEFKCA